MKISTILVLCVCLCSTETSINDLRGTSVIGYLGVELGKTIIVEGRVEGMGKHSAFLRVSTVNEKPIKDWVMLPVSSEILINGKIAEGDSIIAVGSECVNLGGGKGANHLNKELLDIISRYELVKGELPKDRAPFNMADVSSYFEIFALIKEKRKQPQ